MLTVKNVIISFNNTLKDTPIPNEISRFMCVCAFVCDKLCALLCAERKRERERDFNSLVVATIVIDQKSYYIFPFTLKQTNLIGFILDSIRRIASFYLYSHVCVSK